MLVFSEIGRVLEQRDGAEEEEDPHLDEFAQENGSDCGTR